MNRKSYQILWQAGILLLLSFFLPGISACRAGKTENSFAQGVNLPPLAVYSPQNPVSGKRERLQLLGPVAEKFRISGTDHSELSIRPFWSRVFSYRETKNQKTAAVSRDILWPIGGFRRLQDESYFWFFPVFHFHSESGVFQNYLFPCISFGRERDGQYAFSFFPLYGTVRNMVPGMDWDYILFPLYSRFMQSSGKEYSILWPIVSFQENARIRKTRFFPVYSQKETIGLRKNISVLWPVFNYSWSLDREKPGSSLLLIPLGGYQDWGNTRACSFLSPFFMMRENNGDEFFLSLATPFFRYGSRKSDPESRLLYFWPFWGYSRTAASRYSFICWPLYISLQSSQNNLASSWEYFFPFFLIHHTAKHEKEEKRQTAVNHHFWPFYSREQEKDSIIRRIPDLMPFGRKSALERNYMPFLTFYKGISNHAGESHEILWGFIRSTEADDFSEFAFGPFYMHRLQKEKMFLDLCFSMIRMEKDEEKYSFRILWVLDF